MVRFEYNEDLNSAIRGQVGMDDSVSVWRIQALKANMLNVKCEIIR